MEDIDVARLRMEVIARMDVRAFGDLDDMVRAADKIMKWILEGDLPVSEEGPFDQLLARRRRAEQAEQGLKPAQNGWMRA